MYDSACVRLGAGGAAGTSAATGVSVCSFSADSNACAVELDRLQGNEGHQLPEERVDGVVLVASVDEAPLLLPALEGRVDAEPSLRLSCSRRVGATGAVLEFVLCRPSHFPCCHWEPPSLPSSSVQSAVQFCPEEVPCQEVGLSVELEDHPRQL